MNLKFNLTSKITLILLLFFCAFLANMRYQQYKNQLAIDREKESLKQQIDSLSKKNEDLSNSLSYLGSSDFKEQAARQQLNLKRNGEIVFGFSGQAGGTTSGGGQDNSGGPNYEKWINYFFGND